MLKRSLLFKCLFLTSLLSFIVGCNPNKDEGSPAASDPNSEIQAWTGHPLPIPLSEVSDQCLNIQKYFETIRSLSPATKARKLATDFKFRTIGNSVPRNFLLRMAAGNFELSDTDLLQLNEFPKVVQTDCKTVTFSEEGHNEVYQISQAKKDSLTLRNEWKGQAVYTWKTPQSIEIKTTSVTGDFLCSPDSKGEVTTTHLVTWGDTSVFTETLSDKAVSSSFLSLVAEATGIPLRNLYMSPVSSRFMLLNEETPVETPVEEPSEPTAPVENAPPTVEPPPVVEEPQPPVEAPPVIAPPSEPVADELPVAGSPLRVDRLKALTGAAVRPDLLQCY